MHLSRQLLINLKKIRARVETTLQRKGNPQFRPVKNLLTDPPNILHCPKGIPQFGGLWDVNKSKARAFRKVNMAAPKRVRRDYTMKDWHEMLGRFRFQIDGSFEGDGEVYAKAFRQVCADLWLVGWVKARGGFVTGHLQGDVYALSHMKKWISDRCGDGAAIENYRFFDENFAIAAVEYTNLKIVRDLRKPAKKKEHALVRLQSEMNEEAQLESEARRNEEQQYLDDNCVRNY
uniref:Acylphosphatase-like domain-containing protein n=1 Tax=Chromera velia CCMP2878 TaxID=1169474 RepID=A0A0G4HDV9_9ALVE|eukprot:Cvel_26520.t1-p1 / transcript=Cvel_26520.t1 / gene=Cvel_26520 / organism=Chromera_velia_CCMP2878 / gene_product=hypothetical protein / transcript_product=hypothetical protein / location=Cvel_scaffold3167:14305-17459(-) / protein_length=232 / sequence_SO=supercontig / SO=protein_coding / is_pseudo=false